MLAENKYGNFNQKITRNYLKITRLLPCLTRSYLKITQKIHDFQSHFHCIQSILSSHCPKPNNEGPRDEPGASSKSKDQMNYLPAAFSFNPIALILKIAITKNASDPHTPMMMK